MDYWQKSQTTKAGLLLVKWHQSLHVRQPIAAPNVCPHVNQRHDWSFRNLLPGRWLRLSTICSLQPVLWTYILALIGILYTNSCGIYFWNSKIGHLFLVYVMFFAWFMTILSSRLLVYKNPFLLFYENPGAKSCKDL